MSNTINIIKNSEKPYLRIDTAKIYEVCKICSKKTKRKTPIINTVGKYVQHLEREHKETIEQKEVQQIRQHLEQITKGVTV